MGMIDGEFAGDPGIGDVGISVADIVQAAVGTDEARRIDHAAEVMQVAAHQIDGRAGGADKFVGRQFDRAAVDQQLPDRVLDQVGIAREIGERRADPGLAGFAVGAAVTHIDGDRRAKKRAVLLLRIVGKLVAGERDRQQIGRHRQFGIGNPGDVENAPLSSRTRPEPGTGMRGSARTTAVAEMFCPGA